MLLSLEAAKEQSKEFWGRGTVSGERSPTSAVWGLWPSLVIVNPAAGLGLPSILRASHGVGPLHTQTAFSPAWTECAEKCEWGQVLSKLFRRSKVNMVEWKIYN